MISVTLDMFEDVISAISYAPLISVDTETTGLAPYKGHRLFSVIVATADEEFYFNFNDGVDHNGNAFPNVLPRELIPSFFHLFEENRRTIFMANAKFDLHMFAVEGLSIVEAVIFDVLSMDRLIFNDHFKYSLDAVAKRYGFEKDDAVEEYIKQHKLFEKFRLPSGTEKKNKFFAKVPWDVMFPYGCRDGRVTYDIGVKQKAILEGRTNPTPRPAPLKIHELEQEITKVCFTMERGGALIDTTLSSEKAKEHMAIYANAARGWHDITGTVFVDSAKGLAPVLTKAGFTLPLTDKGNISITDEFLAAHDSHLTKLIQTHREHYKIANTYYNNFLYFRGDDGYIHPDMKQTGTRTGRFSYGDPNLQNVPDSEVRRAFTAPPEYCIVSLDYDQQEYKVMLDYAKEMGVIEAVLNGLDVHQATANMMGVERQPAKTLNFLLLYGGGVVKLCLALYGKQGLVKLGEPQLWAIYKRTTGLKMNDKERAIYANIPEPLIEEHVVLLRKAKALRDLYFEKLPNVKKFINRVSDAAAARGYIQTWAGRILQFPNKSYSYKAPNALIQGGCADIGKYAMLGIDKFLKGRKSRMKNVVHDEVNLYVHESELWIVPEVKQIMENIFPYTAVPLTCGVSHSWDNWYDLEKGIPLGKTTRNAVQGEG